MIQELRILDNDNVTLFDKGAHYVIPLYQRAYAWEDEEIVQLIDDINDSTGDYYIGSLVVAKVKGREERYEVVDGQQRLTTLYLLLHYLGLTRRPEWGGTEKLTFSCRQKSNDTLERIQDLLPDEKRLADDEDRLEQSIMNGLKVIKQKLPKGNAVDDVVAVFIERLKSVILYRIEVPDHTDLNRYFEIMNTRGEQLEQHDILKAQLMGYLPTSEQEFFSRVWSACSDMTGYVQMHFAKAEREEIFGEKWDKMPSDKWTAFKACWNTEQQDDREVTIMKIIDPDFHVEMADGLLEDGKTIRFESIIGFPHFLLHVLRAFLEVGDASLNGKKKLGDQLDDKNLLTDFRKVIRYGSIGAKPVKEHRALFARKFILFLLRSRFLFDQFIIKREYEEDDQEGVWSLKELRTSGSKKNKQPSYINTKLCSPNEGEETYAPRNKESLMIQSALRVSYTSPKVMHWITDLLKWLFNNYATEGMPNLPEAAERIAAKAVQTFLKAGKYKSKFRHVIPFYAVQTSLKAGEYKFGVQTPDVVFNYLDFLLWKDYALGVQTSDAVFYYLDYLLWKDYALGVQTPHIVFNYLDYLLWKSDKKKYNDFVFEFRNSVEHWYPQNPSERSFETWNKCDRFGNLCIISRSVNSKFSNLSPQSKMKTYEKMVQKGSLKLRIMGDIIEGCSNEEWKQRKCVVHEKDMISILTQRVGEILPE